MSKVKRWDIEKTDAAEKAAIKNHVELALKVMTSVETEAWRYKPELTRNFSQKEYEIIRHLLLAYLEIVS